MKRNPHGLVATRGHRPTGPRVIGLLLAVVLLALPGVPGCSAVGYPFAILEGDPKPQDVAAKYPDLVGKRFAVMVMVDDFTRYRFPDAARNISFALTGAINRYVEGVTGVKADEVIAYQEANPYWNAVPPRRLIAALGVERLIVVDVAEYRTQEPGNAYLWRGVIDATVAVYEAEAADPDNMSFEEPVRVEYPPGRTVGLTEGDNETMQVGALKAFTLSGAGLFYDHQE